MNCSSTGCACSCRAAAIRFVLSTPDRVAIVRRIFDQCVAGYHRGGKTVCKLTDINSDHLDAFVLDKVRRVHLGDHKTTAKAIDAFVAAVLAQRKPAAYTKNVERDLDAVNRKVKATIAMLADPTFDGLDELRTALADLKAKRDALQARLKPPSRRWARRICGGGPPSGWPRSTAYLPAALTTPRLLLWSRRSSSASRWNPTPSGRCLPVRGRPFRAGT